jgi:hypothetical protein
MIDFSTTKEEMDLIVKIAKRAEPMFADAGIGWDQVGFLMDMRACHANGTPLDFERLLSFPDFDFAHDVFGIRRHLDRSNGEIKDFFLPRCSK